MSVVLMVMRGFQREYAESVVLLIDSLSVDCLDCRQIGLMKEIFEDFLVLFSVHLYLAALFRLQTASMREETCLMKEA